MKIALVGYGEVGHILAEDLAGGEHALRAYDIKLHQPEERAALQTHADSHGIMLTESHGDAVSDADLVVCAVTASQTVTAAESCSGSLQEQAFYLDLNSASPAAKMRAAAHVTRGGGRYVEGAVMTTVPLHRIRVPLLLCGPHAVKLEPVLAGLGFRGKLASSEFGVASATKMCRSVVVKGLEAMLIESFTAARHYGVESAMLASLAETFPGIDWEKQATY